MTRKRRNIARSTYAHGSKPPALPAGETSLPKDSDQTRPCNVCGEGIPLAAKKCTHCDAYQEHKLCSVCGLPIPKAASKCTHCDTYQGWARYVNFSTTMVALITALISVIAASLPAIRLIVKGDDSDMKLTFQRVSGGALLFLASNEGTRPGAISEAGVRLAKANGGQIWVRLSTIKRKTSDTGGSGTEFLEPGKSAQYELSAESLANVERASPRLDEYTCKMRIKTIEFSGIQKCIDAVRSCTDIEGALPYIPRTSSAKDFPSCESTWLERFFKALTPYTKS